MRFIKMTDKVYSIKEIKEKIKTQENFFKQKYHVNKFLIFGSYAKGEQTSESDIDLLVEFKETIDMFEMIDLQNYLTDLFGKKVDLGTPKGLKSFIKNKILNEAIVL
jgi:predicted nucleotidyltransferase